MFFFFADSSPKVTQPFGISANEIFEAKSDDDLKCFDRTETEDSDCSSSLGNCEKEKAGEKVEKESTTYFFDEFEQKHTLRDDAEREIGRGTSQDNNSTFSFTRCFNIFF